jgi:RNase P/RNase MRP subunit POP5
LLKRVKRRYLAVQVNSDSAVSQREFWDAVWAAVIRLYGEYGASQTGLKLFDFNEEKKTAVFRVSLITLPQVRASLVSVTRIGSNEAAVHVTAISGTIKSLREKM